MPDSRVSTRHARVRTLHQAATARMRAWRTTRMDPARNKSSCDPGLVHRGLIATDERPWQRITLRMNGYGRGSDPRFVGTRLRRLGLRRASGGAAFFRG